MSRRLPITRSRTVLAAALALAAAGCGDSNLLGVHEGRVRFVLSPDAAPVTATDQAQSFTPSIRGTEADSHVTSFDGDREHGDRPSFFFASANVTFSSILARNLDGVLVNVDMELPTTVDVVAMEGGREVVLPDGDLPPATYDQLVVVMTAVQGVTRDGTTITIEPPGGGWTAIVPVCEFVVEEGATTVVGLNFMVHGAFKWKFNRFHFEPRFHCGDDDPEEPVTG